MSHSNTIAYPVKLGQVTATSAVHAWSKGSFARANGIGRAVAQHAQGSWGALDAEDAERNRIDLAWAQAHGWSSGRVMSVWPVDGETLWVITDFAGQQTVTTILFPGDY